jgi:hypothetical protein
MAIYQQLRQPGPKVAVTFSSARRIVRKAMNFSELYGRYAQDVHRFAFIYAGTNPWRRT